MEYIIINKNPLKINKLIVQVNTQKVKFLDELWSRCGLEKGVFMRKKSLKVARMERNRRSVFYDDLKTCSNCGSTYQMTLHELFEGKNRLNSMKYGFVIPLCLKCHRALQEDKEFNDKWKRKAQKYFEEYIGTRKDFLDIFRRNYL